MVTASNSKLGVVYMLSSGSLLSSLVSLSTSADTAGLHETAGVAIIGARAFCTRTSAEAGRTSSASTTRRDVGMMRPSVLSPMNTGEAIG